jgi:hypothetical protein
MTSTDAVAIQAGVVESAYRSSQSATRAPGGRLGDRHRHYPTESTQLFFARGRRLGAEPVAEPFFAWR